MDPLAIGIIGVIFLFVLIATGMHIGVAMGIVGIVGIAAITNVDAALGKLGMTVWTMTAYYPIAVLPLFLLMGEFATLSGLTEGIYKAAHKWLGRLPGGLAMSTVGGCAGFAAVCGSSLATATAVAAVALPEMRKYKYDSKLALGCIAAGGTLGILIPPSSGFILYGLITEQSIGRLFMAGIFPGLLEASLYMITIYILCKHNPLMGPRGPAASWRERLIAFKDVWGVLILFLVVMGGIYLGIFTPTEAAAAGAFCALLFTLGRRRLTITNFTAAIMNTLRITGMVFVIIFGALLFGYLVTQSRLAITLAEFTVNLPLSPILILIFILCVFLVLGCIMDAYAMLLLIVPIFFPVVIGLGFDPIWFAVLVVVTMEMGLITPPIGLNVFVLAGVARDVPMFDVFRGILPFFLADLVHLILEVAFPQIALFLPSRMMSARK